MPRIGAESTTLPTLKNSSLPPLTPAPSRGPEVRPNPPMGKKLVALSGQESQVTYQQVEGEVFVKGAEDVHPVSPNDIQQGYLGDCYLLASLSAIAQSNPGFIEKMIRRHEDGTYTVYLYQRRGADEVGAGDYKRVPVRITGELPHFYDVQLFARSPEEAPGAPELWVALIEKAYASLKGSYKRIEGGWPDKVMPELTGRHAFRQKTEKVGVERLAQLLAAGNAVTISTETPKRFLGLIKLKDRRMEKEHFNNGTLAVSHAYVVRSVDVEKGTVTVGDPYGPQAGRPDVEMSYAQVCEYFDKVMWTPTR